MTRAKAFITRRTRWAASLGAIGGFCVSLIGAAVTGASLYYGLEARIVHAQSTADSAVASAADLKADLSKQLDDMKSDVREIRNDVKSLLQRK